MSYRDDDLIDFCKRLPKCELHAHLNGSLGFETLEALDRLKISRSNGVYHGLSEHEKALIKLNRPRTLTEMFQIFPIVQYITQTVEAIEMATAAVIVDFADDNVRYLELRSTPRSSNDGGMSKRDYIEAICRAIRTARTRRPPEIEVRLLLSVDRRQSETNAQETIELAIEYAQHEDAIVVGVELSGDPSFDSRPFLPLFAAARGAGLKVSLHLAESADHLDELWDCLLFSPDRIGHGTFIHHRNASGNAAPSGDDSQLPVDLVLARRIPIEICLSSNVLCGTTPTFADSHLQFWLNHRNFPLCISTDDKGLMLTSLSAEYVIAGRTFTLDKQTLFDLSLRALRAAFICPGAKENLEKHWLEFARQEKLVISGE